jgi:Rrf2 family protein
MKLKKSNSYALHALMYMVRHSTQLPINLRTISKAERIPHGQLMKIFNRLAKAGFVKDMGRKGYAFERAPQEIMLLDLFELFEGDSIFGDCFMRHCDCGGTYQNCEIFAHWVQATRSLSAILAKTSVHDAAWNHPEHFFR